MSKQIFNFEFIDRISIPANDLSQAIKIFQELYPGVESKDINHIDRRSDDQRMTFVCSDSTGERIYYEPGCQYGYIDCILDPMEDIARQCAHQSDMTPDKWISCKNPDPDEDTCNNYDDECK